MLHPRFLVIALTVTLLASATSAHAEEPTYSGTVNKPGSTVNANQRFTVEGTFSYAYYAQQADRIEIEIMKMGEVIYSYLSADASGNIGSTSATYSTDNLNPNERPLLQNTGVYTISVRAIKGTGSNKQILKTLTKSITVQ